MRNLAFELGREANFSEVSAIYGFSGETNIAHMESVMAQSADILHPQLEEFGGPKPVVIPVGADQDPHIKLTRDLAYRMRKFLVELRGDYISIRGKAASPELMQAAEAALKEWESERSRGTRSTSMSQRFRIRMASTQVTWNQSTG